jgi:hypothetical protein
VDVQHQLIHNLDGVVDALSSKIPWIKPRPKSLFFVFHFLFKLFAIDGARLWRQAQAGGNRLVAAGFWRIRMWSLRGQLLAL